MTTFYTIENTYLYPANIYSPKVIKAIASQWTVTFADGRVICYRITIVKGKFESEYFNDHLYIQIDDCSTPKNRDIPLFQKKTKLPLKRTTLNELYKIAQNTFDYFNNEGRIPFKNISQHKNQWIRAIEKQLRNHITIPRERSRLLPAEKREDFVSVPLDKRRETAEKSRRRFCCFFC